MQVGRPDERVDDEGKSKVLDPVAQSLKKVSLLTGVKESGETSGGGLKVDNLMELTFEGGEEFRVGEVDGGRAKALDR